MIIYFKWKYGLYDSKELDDPQLFDDPNYSMIPSYLMEVWPQKPLLTTGKWFLMRKSEKKGPNFLGTLLLIFHFETFIAKKAFYDILHISVRKC